MQLGLSKNALSGKFITGSFNAAIVLIGGKLSSFHQGQFPTTRIVSLVVENAVALGTLGSFPALGEQRGKEAASAGTGPSVVLDSGPRRPLHSALLRVGGKQPRFGVKHFLQTHSSRREKQRARLVLPSRVKGRDVQWLHCEYQSALSAADLFVPSFSPVQHDCCVCAAQLAVELIKLVIALGLEYEDIEDVAIEICGNVLEADGYRGDIICPGVVQNYGPHVRQDSRLQYNGLIPPNFRFVQEGNLTEVHAGRYMLFSFPVVHHLSRDNPGWAQHLRDV